MALKNTMKKQFYCAASFALFLGFNLPVAAQQKTALPRSVGCKAALVQAAGLRFFGKRFGISATSRARTSSLSIDPRKDGLTD